MNEVSISGWVVTAPVAHRLGTHAVYSEFGLGLAMSASQGSVPVFCHGRLAAKACSNLDVGDVVEIHGYLCVLPDFIDATQERISVIADALGLPGRPTL